VIGKKGRDLLIRRNLPVIAEFSNLPSPAKFMDVVAVGRLLVDDYLTEEFDQVYLSFTEFISMSSQVLKFRKLLPLELDVDEGLVSRTNSQSVHKYDSPFTYEPDQYDVLNQIIPRFTAIQVFQAILSAQASEHASRMLAMRNATDNANELVGMLQLDYNKMRQQAITNDMLDIVSGANALVEIG
jgi:F-type H+-transporting ATPase subunit gamma